MKTAIALACTLAVTACATVPPPATESATRVRFVTAEQAKPCTFLKTVSVNETLVTVGKYPALMKATGEMKIRDAAVAAGGNTLVLTSEDQNFFWGTINYAGEAYRCAA